MDPNEYQDNQPITDPEQTLHPTEQQPGPEQPQNTGTYHGTGAGRKESPYANSPYYAYDQAYGAQDRQTNTDGAAQQQSYAQSEQPKKTR